MRTLLQPLLTAVILLACFVGPLDAQQPASSPPASGEVLTNADVVRMVSAGLGDDIVIDKIGSAPCNFDTSIDAVLQLKAAGVSDKVIKAMLAKSSAKEMIAPEPLRPEPRDRRAAATPESKRRKESEPATPRTTIVSADFPTLTPLEEAGASQTKGGITIAVAPVEYTLVQDYKSRVRTVNPSFRESMFLPRNPGDVFIERTCIPTLEVRPNRLRFQVTVANQMSRVFHGAGLVIQFNIAGRLVAVDHKSYSELANSIIPPRSQQQFEIYGPELNTLPSQAAIALFFYDVVTAVDGSGNVSEKQNFQWTFQYATQEREQEMEIPPPDRMYAGPGRPISACMVGGNLRSR